MRSQNGLAESSIAAWKESSSKSMGVSCAVPSTYSPVANTSKDRQESQKAAIGKMEEMYILSSLNRIDTVLRHRSNFERFRMFVGRELRWEGGKVIAQSIF